VRALVNEPYSIEAIGAAFLIKNGAVPLIGPNTLKCVDFIRAARRCKD
jgi:hypothetical protein